MSHHPIQPVTPGPHSGRAERTGGVRHRLIGAVFAAVVIASSLAAVIAMTDVPTRSPGVGVGSSAADAPTTADTRPRIRPLGFGLSYGDALTWMPDEQLDRAMADARELGVTWLRVDLSWKNIQPDAPYQYLWERFDRVVDAADSHGLRLVPTLSYTPRWARDPVCAHTNQSCPPADNARFAEFSRLAAVRYAPRGVHTWEIWNEPNIKSFWKSGPDATRYTALLTATAKAVRSVDSDAYLLLGGLAAVDTIPSKQYVSHKTFLAELGRAGALRQVDALSYHPYTYPLLPSTETATGTRFQDIDRSPDNLVSTLKRYGKPDMPIWLTETGAPTWSPGTAADSQDARGTTHVTPRLQAEIAADTVTTSAAIPSVAVVCWYSYQDAGPEGSDSRKSRHYGLTYHDGTRKPAFDAYKEAIRAYENGR